MGPFTQQMWPKIKDEKVRERVRNGAHILITHAMFRRLCDLAQSMPDGTPFEGRLPFPDTTVEVEGTASYYFGEADLSIYPDAPNPPHGMTELHCLGLDTIAPVVTPGYVLMFENRSDLYHLSRKYEHISDHDLGLIIACTAVFDLLFSLMAEPAFITREAVPRNSAKWEKSRRILNLPRTVKTDWIKIGWTLGAPRQGARHEAERTYSMPFHMRRAHWRRYDHPTPKSELRPGFPGNWVWIEAQYVGNPAMGEVQHHYMPKLEYPGKSSKLVVDHLSAKFHAPAAAFEVQP